MINIRLAQVSDAKELMRLNNLFNGDGLNSLKNIENSLRNNDQEIVAVAIDGTSVVGFASGRVYQSFCYCESYAEIAEIYVMNDYRMQGVGKQLMVFLESEFLKKGAKSYQLLTGSDNEEAQRFYKSLGYTKSEEVQYRKRLKNSVYDEDKLHKG